MIRTFLFSIFLLGLFLNLHGIVNYNPATNTYTVDRYGADFKPKPTTKYKPFDIPKEKNTPNKK